MNVVGIVASSCGALSACGLAGPVIDRNVTEMAARDRIPRHLAHRVITTRQSGLDALLPRA